MYRKKKPMPAMTISDSRTKLNQIDCERRFNFFNHIITCAVPKSRINDHFYSDCKDTAEKDRERLLPQQRPISCSHICGAYSDL